MRPAALSATLACLTLLAAACSVRWLGWSYVSRDVEHFLYHWIEELRQLGFSGLALSSANYNPPYLYLLLVGIQLDPAGSAVHITKSVSTLFDVALAFAVAWSVSVRRMEPAAAVETQPKHALLVALMLPTVWMNSAVWGQCDAIYSTWLLLGFVLAERRHEGASALCLASALAFKLQAAFLGPVVLAIFWCSIHRWKFALLVVLGYLSWLWPSVLAGRSWSDALTVYVRQATAELDLSLGAPNLWTLAKHVFTDPSTQKALLASGIVLAVVLALAAIPLCIRFIRRSRANLLPLAATCAFMVPFMLPKMHDRYFYPADVFSVAMAFRDRRWVPIAALIQLGSLTAYLSYLTELPGPVVRLPGIVANCVAVVLLILYWRREWMSLQSQA